jgi:Actinobacteria/chloroflexi VLRF1 release factor
MQREHLTRRRLLARLHDEGAPGWASYRTPRGVPSLHEVSLPTDDASRIAELAAASETGSVLFARAGETTLIVPPFVVEEDLDYSEMYCRPLVQLLERPRVAAVFLLRLGGFSVGFFRGDAVVDSKTDRRFVKNRHRKGGQSQRRFDRIREKQVHELFGKACAEAREKLGAYEDEIEHVFFGGDRLTLLAFRKECTYFERFGDRLMRRILPVPGDPRRASLDAMPAEIWSSDVYTFGGDALDAPATIDAP